MTDNQLLQLQYQVVADRRSAADSLLWQAPVLSLTAQAFLFTVSLEKDACAESIAISSLLGVTVAFASIHLMWKHRVFELRDSMWLEMLEGIMKLPMAHSQPKLSLFVPGSYCVWMVMLTGFGAASLWTLKNALVSLFPSIDWLCWMLLCWALLAIFTATLMCFPSKESIKDRVKLILDAAGWLA